MFEGVCGKDYGMTKAIGRLHDPTILVILENEYRNIGIAKKNESKTVYD